MPAIGYIPATGREPPRFPAAGPDRDVSITVTLVRVLILRAAGTNCDLETRHAWNLAGADAELVHVRRLIERPESIHQYQILTIPGGFSYGDDIAAGRILARQVHRHLVASMRSFIDAGRLVLGICNGFQVLVQAGLLPFRQPSDATRKCSIVANEPPGFQDRWVYLHSRGDRCPFLEPRRICELPIAHGEGRVVFARPSDLERVTELGQDVLTYGGPPAGTPNLHGPPLNPNGSQGDIAGLCDETGRVLGLMPHPERFVAGTQHPCWTSRPPREHGDGLDLFRRAVAYFA
jgi:phosphoribosylformylglycinamidine synthase I